MMQHAEIEKLRQIRDQKKENAQKAKRHAERRKVQEQGAGYQGYSSDTWILIEQAENAQKAFEAAVPSRGGNTAAFFFTVLREAGRPRST